MPGKCDRIDQAGGVLVFVALLIPAILAMLALAVDVGLFFVYRNNLQQVADASSLVAVDELSSFRFQQNFRDINNNCEMLANPDEVDLYDNRGFRVQEFEEEDEGCDPLEDETQIDRRARRFSTPVDNQSQLFVNYKNIKPTILALLSRQNIRGLNSEGQNALNTSSSTTSDSRVRFSEVTFGGESCFQESNPNLDYDQHRTSCASAGNLEIRVTRGVRCYSNPASIRRLVLGDNDSPWSRDRYFCPRESSDMSAQFLNSWEWANSVLIELRLNNVASMFTQAAFGLTTTDISVRSVGYLPTVQSSTNTPLCGLPLCSEVFRSDGDDSTEPSFDPSSFNCQVIGQWII